MKIHNSSLTLTPVRPSQTPGRDSNVSNNESSVAKETQNKKVNQPSSPEEIKKASLSIDLTGQDNIIKPTDSKTLRALSAYTQQFNAPLQDQRAQLITGIDAYA